MPKIVSLNNINEYPPTPLVKSENGLYPYSTTRCGILPYYRKGNKIFWGCVKSNRVGPTTVATPAGIQDILVKKNERCFNLEVGKPFPNLDYDFLQEFVGKLFRDQIYQDIIACFIENKFEIYIENAFVTAIHETREEHGVDLEKDRGLNHFLLNKLVQLPIQRLSGKLGASAQRFWVASLSNIDGVVLSDTKKIENKIRRNFGREFFEQGCWGTLYEFKAALLEAKKFSTPYSSTTQQNDLIKGVLDTYEDTIEFLENLELLIRANFNKSAFPLGLYPFISTSGKKYNQVIQEIFTIKAALKYISFDTWLILDLDNTVMESTLEVITEQWFNTLVGYTKTVILDSKEATRLALLIYDSVQNHIHSQEVEPGVIKTVRALQDIGIPIVASTARDIAIKHSIIRQLEKIGVDFSRTCINVENPSYEKGIIFCNGESADKVIQQFITQCPTHPAHIVMLDDKKRPLEHMKDVAKTLKIKFTGLRYGFLDGKTSRFDMKTANHQLAYLKKYLPRDAQDTIARLELLSSDVEPTASASIFSGGFFNRNERVGLLPGIQVCSEPIKDSFYTK